MSNLTEISLFGLDIETECNVDSCADKECGHALDFNRNRITLICVTDDAGTDRIFNDTASFLQWDNQNPCVRYAAHNGKFDIKHLIAHGAPSSLINKWTEDSSLLAFTYQDKIEQPWLDQYEEERRKHNSTRTGMKHRKAGPHSLKTTAPYYLNVDPFWEPEAGHNDVEYALKDAKYCLRLTKYFLSKLDPKSISFYYDKYINWTKMLLRAELKGVFVDSDELDRKWTKSADDEEVILKDIKTQWRDYFDLYKLERAKEIVLKYEEKIKEKPAREVYYTKLCDAAISKIEGFNIDSPKQLLWLFDKMGIDAINLDGEASTNKETLNRLSIENKQIEKLLQYRKIKKLNSTYYPEYKDYIYNNRIHADFHVTEARTGRLSCIAEDTLITIPGGYKKIQDIVVGDLVYSYTDKGTLAINKVLATINNGIQECVTVKWQSSGTGKIGELICTDDHQIKTKKGWKKASDLKQGDKAFHLKRSLLSSGRVRLYGTNSYQELEEQAIKRLYYKAPSYMDIHHIDGNKINNHQILSVKPLGTRQVYDLTVENDSNFIANEICVHNCRNPNLQQVVGDLHALFKADPGCKLITRDLSAIEPTLLAYYSEDEALCNLMIKGGDFHSTNAKYAFNLECEASEVKTLYPNLRKVAKTVGLAVLYGAGANRVYQSFVEAGLNEMTFQDAQRFVFNIRELYSGVWNFKKELDRVLERGEIVYNFLGRPFAIPVPQDVYMKGLNTLIQSSASDLLQQAAYDFSIKHTEGSVLLLIHDEVIVQAKKEDAQLVENELIKEMCKFKLQTKHGYIKIKTEGKVSDVWEK